jgi:hypothetical protein
MLTCQGSGVVWDHLQSSIALADEAGPPLPLHNRSLGPSWVPPCAQLIRSCHQRLLNARALNQVGCRHVPRWANSIIMVAPSSPDLPKAARSQGAEFGAATCPAVPVLPSDYVGCKDIELGGATCPVGCFLSSWCPPPIGPPGSSKDAGARCTACTSKRAATCLACVALLPRCFPLISPTWACHLEGAR